MSKAERVIGPSMIQGALSSWQRSPAMKVCVFQWPKGALVRKPLALAAAPAQAGHLGVDVGLVEEHQPMRLLAHAG